MANEITIFDAIQSLKPNASFGVDDDDTITWKSYNSDKQPSDSEIAAERSRLQAIYDGNAYQRTREPAYEDIKDQLDKLYHDMTAGKLDATGEWHKSIKAVKDANPKP